MLTYAARPTRRTRAGKTSQHYWVRVYRPDGRRTWKSTEQARYEDAVTVLKRWKREAALGQDAPRDYSFSEAIDKWYEEKVADGISVACQNVWKCYVRLQKRHFGKTRLAEVDRDALLRYFKVREKGRPGPDGKPAPLSPVSIGNEKRMLRIFMGWCFHLGWLHRNPAKLLKIEPSRPSLRVLDEEQEKRFLKEAQKAGDDVYGRCFAMLRSGLRGGTLTLLEWSRHVDWDRGEWTIPGEFMKAKDDFHAPIADDLFAYLRERRRPGGRIFARLNREKFRKVAADAGVPWLRPHSLRKTFVTRCGRAGVGLEVAASLSDHRDISTMVKVYRQIDPDEKRKALVKVFGKAKKKREAGA